MAGRAQVHQGARAGPRTFPRCPGVGPERPAQPRSGTGSAPSGRPRPRKRHAAGLCLAGGSGCPSASPGAMAGWSVPQEPPTWARAGGGRGCASPGAQLLPGDALLKKCNLKKCSFTRTFDLPRGSHLFSRSGQYFRITRKRDQGSPATGCRRHVKQLRPCDLGRTLSGSGGWKEDRCAQGRGPPTDRPTGLTCSRS